MLPRIWVQVDWQTSITALARSVQQESVGLTADALKWCTVIYVADVASVIKVQCSTVISCNGLVCRECLLDPLGFHVPAPQRRSPGRRQALGAGRGAQPPGGAAGRCNLPWTNVRISWRGAQLPTAYCGHASVLPCISAKGCSWTMLDILLKCCLCVS